MLRFGAYSTEVFAALCSECSLICRLICERTDQGVVQARGISSCMDADTQIAQPALQGSSACAAP